MAFVKFSRRGMPRSGTPTVTLQRLGTLSINKAAHDLINGAMTVDLLYDPEERIIGLQPAAPSETTYELREPSSTGLTLISVNALAKAYKIDLSYSRRYVPRLEEGILCIYLNGESTVLATKTKEASIPEPTEEAPSN